MDSVLLAAVILLVLWIASLPLGAYALIHAAMQRSDAFTAADKLSKPAWLGISGGALLALALSQGPGGGGMIFWIAGLVASIVYIVDVGPKLKEVQGGSFW